MESIAHIEVIGHLMTRFLPITSTPEPAISFSLYQLFSLGFFVLKAIPFLTKLKTFFFFSSYWIKRASCPLLEVSDLPFPMSFQNECLWSKNYWETRIVHQKKILVHVLEYRTGLKLSTRRGYEASQWIILMRTGENREYFQYFFGKY